MLGHDLEVVGEVPGSQAAGLESDEGVVIPSVRVRPALLVAEVPASDLANGVGIGATKHDAATNLYAAIRWIVLADDDARSRVRAEMAHLHIVSARHDVEAAVSPTVPDR